MITAGSVLELVSIASICLCNLNALHWKRAALEQSWYPTAYLEELGSRATCFPSLQLPRGVVCCLHAIESASQPSNVPHGPDLEGVVREFHRKLKPLSSSLLNVCNTSTISTLHPASSSCRLKVLECRSTSCCISPIFIFSKSSTISLPSSTSRSISMHPYNSTTCTFLTY